MIDLHRPLKKGVSTSMKKAIHDFTLHVLWLLVWLQLGTSDAATPKPTSGANRIANKRAAVRNPPRPPLEC